MQKNDLLRTLLASIMMAAMICIDVAQVTAAETAAPLELQPLIQEALKNNHEVWVAEAKWRGSASRVKLAGSLPDPMLMIGYQNEGWNEYTLGKMVGAQWMYSISQMFPFPGKRALKEEMASRDADTAEAMYRAEPCG